MEYHEPRAYSHEEVENIMQTGKGMELNYMLVGVAYNEPDFCYAFNIVKKYCFDSNISLQRLAIECISDLARIHGFLPIEEAKQLFSNIIEGKTGSELVIMGHMYDVLGDLSIYAPEIYKSIRVKYPAYCKAIGFEDEI